MARLIHPLSKECMLDEFNIFGVPLTQTCVEACIEQSLKPVAPLTASPDLIEYKIPSEGGMYTDLRSPHLELEVQVVDKDGKAVKSDAKVAITNNFAHNLFQKIDTMLNGTSIASSSGNYPWKAYFHNLFGCRRSAKSNYLSIVPWLKDVSGKMDEPNYERNKMVDITKSFQVVAFLLCDLFMQDRFMISTADILIRLQRSAPGFALVAEDDQLYTVNIINATLHYTKYQVSEALLEAHMAAMLRSTAKYPFVRTEVKPWFVAADQKFVSIDSGYHGDLPIRVIAVFVDEDAYNGNIKKNPLNLKHKTLKSASAIHNGRSFPSKPYSMDFPNRKAAKPFHDGYVNTGQLRDMNPTLDITFPEYLDGYTFIAWNFNPDLSDASDEHINLLRRGNIRFEFEFNEKLAESTVILLFGQFNSMLEIDNSNAVHKEY